MAQALGVPLFRRVIRGSAVEQEAEYGARTADSPDSGAGVTGDETEDLFELLKTVKVVIAESFSPHLFNECV